MWGAAEPMSSPNCFLFLSQRATSAVLPRLAISDHIETQNIILLERNIFDKVTSVWRMLLCNELTYTAARTYMQGNKAEVERPLRTTPAWQLVQDLIRAIPSQK
jgi:hypothetical protein